MKLSKVQERKYIACKKLCIQIHKNDYASVIKAKKN